MYTPPIPALSAAIQTNKNQNATHMTHLLGSGTKSSLHLGRADVEKTVNLLLGPVTAERIHHFGRETGLLLNLLEALQDSLAVTAGICAHCIAMVMVR